MQPTAQTENEKEPLLFRIMKRVIVAFSPKYTLHGTENLPEEPCVIVGNHCQFYGPIAAECYKSRPRYIWCIGEMLNRKEAAAYAYKDFWPDKPRGTGWYFRLLSHLLAGPLSYLLSHAHTIPVYRDTRVMTTFRRSMEVLRNGADVIIFPECHEPYNGIVWQFQEHFTDLAKLYWRRTGKALWFTPMYTAPTLKSIHFGKPVQYNPDAPEEEERKRICRAMQEAITDLAVSLPEHTVVPYVNIPKKDYPKNIRT